MPDCYRSIKQYADEELYPSQWIDIIERLVANNPDVFLILYGGEPFLYPGLKDVVKFCNESNVSYTIISNNTPIARTRAYEIFSALGPFKGFTSSVDPVALMSDEELGVLSKSAKDIVEKSRLGLENLAKMKKDGISEDVVAEITVTNMSLPFLYDTILQLTNNGVWSSITVVDDKKSDYYDFSSVEDQSQMLTKSDAESIFLRIKEDAEAGILKVHIPSLLPRLLDILPSCMKCSIRNDLHNVTIDADGTMRLCLRIRGERCPDILAKTAFSKNGQVNKLLKKAIKRDYDKVCLGCNWTCPLMSDEFADSVIDH